MKKFSKSTEIFVAEFKECWPPTKNKAESLHKWNGKCQMCDTDNVMISAAVIVDDMGTRYRNVCDECYEKYNCKPKKIIQSHLTKV